MSYYDDASLVLIPSGVKASKVYSQKPTNGTGDFTFARASTATRTNASGAIETVASNVPRIDFRNADGTLSSCGRLLLEPQRTNSIRNSSMVGAVAGSPGTLPTNWVNIQLSGLSRQIVGVGTENGLPYVDIRFNGTANALNIRVDFEGSANIAALTAQVWTNSIYAKIVSAPNPAVSYALQIIERTSAGGYVADGSQIFTPTTSLQRFAFTRTLNGGATVANVQPCIIINLTNGATYDFTIRIAAPQMELGAFSSTWIPTTTATVTRLRDDATKSIPTLFSAAAGTFFVDTMPTISTLTNQTIGVVHDAGSNFLIFLALGFDAGSLKLRARNGGTVNTTATGPTITNGQQIKAIVRFNGVNYTLFANGVKYTTGTTNYPSTLNTVTLNGNDLFTGAAQHRVNQSFIFPTALSDAQCIELTTL